MLIRGKENKKLTSVVIHDAHSPVLSGANVHVGEIDLPTLVEIHISRIV